MKQIYEEALADVKKLKAVAEDNAKKALVDAVAPRIKEFIERQMMSDVSDDDDEIDEENFDVTGPAKSQLMTDAAPEPLDGSISLPDEEGKVTLDLDDLDEEEKDGSYVLNMESADILKIMSTSSGFSDSIAEALVLAANKLNNSNGFAEKMTNSFKKIEEDISVLYNASKILKESKAYFNHIDVLFDKVGNMYRQLKESNVDKKSRAVFEVKLDSYMTKLQNLQESNKMRNTLAGRRLRKLTEEDVTLRLTGLPDEVDLEDMALI